MLILFYNSILFIFYTLVKINFTSLINTFIHLKKRRKNEREAAAYSTEVIALQECAFILTVKQC
jgi:hypothetical protein